MNDSCRVRGSKCVEYITPDCHRIRDGQCAPSPQSRAKGFTVDVRHDVIQKTIRRTGREQRNDVRILQPGRDLDLTTKPLDAYFLRNCLRECLDDDLSIETKLAGNEYPAHPASGDFPFDSVVRPYGGIQSLEYVGVFWPLIEADCVHGGVQHCARELVEETIRSVMSAEQGFKIVRQRWIVSSQ